MDHKPNANQTTDKTSILPTQRPKFVDVSNPTFQRRFKLTAVVVFFTLFILLFSLVMGDVAYTRANIYEQNVEKFSGIYNGPLNQNAPTIDRLSLTDQEVISLKERDKIEIDDAKLKNYVANTRLISTSGRVNIEADFAKMGLTYHPSYKTKFQATYKLKNQLKEKSLIAFVFPFPFASDTSEISNAQLTVRDQKISNAKSTVKYDDPTIEYDTPQNISALKWEGELAPEEEITVKVTYETVGVATFRYQGLEDQNNAQDFNFEAVIDGTRSYDVNDGLSVDEREFSKDRVVLKWDKPGLYNTPSIEIEVGNKVDPSVKVSRVYATMLPIYLVLSPLVVFLFEKFSKRSLQAFDLSIFSVLFVVFFPFFHYLSSFTIDPTLEVFARFENVASFSMPLYLAFGLAWVVINSLMIYLVSRISSLSFAFKFLLPTLVLFLGFFPLVVTIPEYSMLLVMIGTIAFLTIVIQVRLKLQRAES